MTESSLLTRCPNCQTRFRVTQEQLGIAAGKVRCGNCMEVFNALEHRSRPEAPAAAANTDQPPASQPPSATGSAADSTAPGDDELLFADNPDEDATEGRYAGTRSSFSDDELSDSFLAIDQHAGSGFIADDEVDTTASIDESWAEAMLSDDDEPATAEPPSPAPEQPAPARRSPAAATPERTSPAAPASPRSSTEPDDWELALEPAFKAPDTPASAADVAVPPPRPPASRAPTAAPGPVEPEPMPEPGLYPEAPEAAPASSGLAADPASPGRPGVRRDSGRDQPYDNLTREPISVTGGGSRGWFGKFLWMLVILALIGGLVSQVVWFQFDRLSAIPELRPFYEKGCELAGCDLAPLVDTDRIQSRKLVVRTSPDNRNALVVDAVIINQAEFAQPFPAIALTFSNLNGDVVAQSLFPPEDYLAGDASALDTMPTDTPIRIALTIRDPGRDAVNYNIAFRPHRQ